MVDSSTQELIKDFMKPTENKGPAVAETVEEKATPQPAPQPETKPGTASRPLELEAEEVKPEPAKPKERMMGAEFVAETFIGIFDTTQTLLLSKINRRKMKRRLGDKLHEAEQLMNEIELGRLKASELTPEQYSLFMRIKDLLKVEEEIPLSDKEYDKLKVPLLKLIEMNNIDLPPNLALLMVAVEVMSPRIIDAAFE